MARSTARREPSLCHFTNSLAESKQQGRITRCGLDGSGQCFAVFRRVKNNSLSKPEGSTTGAGVAMIGKLCTSANENELLFNYHLTVLVMHLRCSPHGEWMRLPWFRPDIHRSTSRANPRPIVWRVSVAPASSRDALPGLVSECPPKDCRPWLINTNAHFSNAPIPAETLQRGLSETSTGLKLHPATFADGC